MSDANLELNKVTVKVTTGGRPYEMRMGDFSAMDELDYQRVTGEDLMTPFTTGRVNSIMVAGLLWLFRRRWEKNLRFETVAESLKWGDLDSVEVTDGSEPKDKDVEKAAALPEVAPSPEG